jgi:hypothetical protein
LKNSQIYKILIGLFILVLSVSCDNRHPDLGIDLSASEDSTFNRGFLDITIPVFARLGEMDLDFGGVKSIVMFRPFWLVSAMKSDGNLPATVLKKYQVIFDYPKKQFILAKTGTFRPQGVGSPASINPKTGIVQMDAIIDGENYSFALDMGASYSFISREKLEKLSGLHPWWPRIKGTLGDANMWGWWPENEASFPVIRIPEIQWGNIFIKDPGIVGVTDFSPYGTTLGDWYSRKTAHHVDGFLGSNVLQGSRVEIDYQNSIVYFQNDSV